MTPWERVSKQMVQMFGPQFTEKFGARNDAWESSLGELSYGQISSGLTKVRQGALKFYELDLPNFLGLCKPASVIPAPMTRVRPRWAEGMPEAEIQLHRQAILKAIVFVHSHPQYGVRGERRLSKAQEQAIWHSLHRLAHDYYEMRQELSADEVPDSDFFTALTRQWRRDLEAGVSA